MISLIIFLLILSILVLIHEFGHFLACKLQGIKVLEFALGFGPRIFAITYKGTEYRVNWILFGGYVRPLGEGEYGSPEEGAFESQRAYKRFLVVISGVIMNFLFAFVVFTVFLATSSYRVFVTDIVDNQFPFGQQSTAVNVQADPSASSQASKDLGEQSYVVETVNNIPVKNGEQLVTYVDSHKGDYLDFKLLNIANQNISHKILYARPNPPKGEGSLGVVLTPIYIINFSQNKVFSGVEYAIDYMQYTVHVLKALTQASVKTHNAKVVTSSVTGPVGLFIITGAYFQEFGITGLLNLVGIISVGLGIMNILPIPALDGGHAFFILIEMIIRRRLNEKFLYIINNIGMGLLILFMVFATINDINNFNVVDMIRHLVVH